MVGDPGPIAHAWKTPNQMCRLLCGFKSCQAKAKRVDQIMMRRVEMRRAVGVFLERSLRPTPPSNGLTLETLRESQLLVPSLGLLQDVLFRADMYDSSWSHSHTLSQVHHPHDN
eukprot:12644-Amphidinium_carterae.1